MRSFKFVYSDYPKALLVPFMAMVMFFSALLFILLVAPVHLIGSLYLESPLYFRDTAVYLWLLSSLLGVPLALYFLKRACDNFKEGKRIGREKEKLRVSDLAVILLVGLPLGFYAGMFLTPFSIFFTRNSILLFFGVPTAFSLGCWAILKKLKRII